MEATLTVSTEAVGEEATTGGEANETTTVVVDAEEVHTRTSHHG